MISDSLAPGIIIRAPDKTSARESEDKARWTNDERFLEGSPTMARSR